MEENRQIKCFGISDSYRIHHYTKNINHFKLLLERYAELMEKSDKQNMYSIFTAFVTEDEYQVTIKNMKKLSATKPRLTIVKGSKDARD